MSITCEKTSRVFFIGLNIILFIIHTTVIIYGIILFINFEPQYGYYGIVGFIISIFTFSLFIIIFCSIGFSNCCNESKLVIKIYISGMAIVIFYHLVIIIVFLAISDIYILFESDFTIYSIIALLIFIFEVIQFSLSIHNLITLKKRERFQNSLAKNIPSFAYLQNEFNQQVNIQQPINNNKIYPQFNEQ